MRVAIVKTSSMGDVIHALPVVADLKRARPGVVIDWIVEQAFAEIPSWQPAVRDVIPVAFRRWRKTPWAAQTRLEFREFRSRLRHNGPYDKVLDLQGLIKSALLARLVPGPSAGYGFRCAREPLAALSYSQRYSVDQDVHAIEKMRALSARVFDYAVTGLPRFDIDLARNRQSVGSGPDPVVSSAPVPRVVLLHATARAEKCWPLEHWRTLVGDLNARGIGTVLPWASPGEQAQAREIGGSTHLNRVPDVVMSLTDCARMFRASLAVVGVDTGLTHLAAALGCPTVSVFGATEPERYGPYWSSKAVNLGGPGRWPSPAEVLQALAPAMAVLPMMPAT